MKANTKVTIVIATIYFLLGILSFSLKDESKTRSGKYCIESPLADETVDALLCIDKAVYHVIHAVCK